MQAGHELSLTAAALVLMIGGGLILLRAALDTRNATAQAVMDPAPSNVLSGSDVATPSPIDLIQRFALWVTVGLSIGAATIHLVAGPEHVQELGGLGLGFYWAALFQLFLAVALLRRPRSRSLAWLGIGGNVALIGAWAWSRTMGLPGVVGGPEMIGVADGTTVLLQIALIALLAVGLGRFDTRFAGGAFRGQHPVTHDHRTGCRPEHRGAIHDHRHRGCLGRSPRRRRERRRGRPRSRPAHAGRRHDALGFAAGVRSTPPADLRPTATLNR